MMEWQNAELTSWSRLVLSNTVHAGGIQESRHSLDAELSSFFLSGCEEEGPTGRRDPQVETARPYCLFLSRRFKLFL